VAKDLSADCNLPFQLHALMGLTLPTRQQKEGNPLAVTATGSEMNSLVEHAAFQEISGRPGVNYEPRPVLSVWSSIELDMVTDDSNDYDVLAAYGGDKRKERKAKEEPDLYISAASDSLKDCCKGRKVKMSTTKTTVQSRAGNY